MLYALCSMLCFAPLAQSVAAPNLTGTVSVEQTADTAFAAKTNAMNSARRQVFNSVLARYADAAAITGASTNLTDAAILNMVATTSIANEKTSTTSYAADVTATLDRAAVEKWLRDNNVPNYMSAADDSGPRTTVYFDVAGGLRAWVSLNQSLRSAGVLDDADMRLASIWGRNVSATINGAGRGAFVAALKNLGWTVNDDSGILKVSK